MGFDGSKNFHCDWEGGKGGQCGGRCRGRSIRCGWKRGAGRLRGRSKLELSRDGELPERGGTIKGASSDLSIESGGIRRTPNASRDSRGAGGLSTQIEHEAEAEEDSECSWILLDEIADIVEFGGVLRLAGCDEFPNGRVLYEFHAA